MRHAHASECQYIAGTASCFLFRSNSNLFVSWRVVSPIDREAEFGCSSLPFSTVFITLVLLVEEEWERKDYSKKEGAKGKLSQSGIVAFARHNKRTTPQRLTAHTSSNNWPQQHVDCWPSKCLDRIQLFSSISYWFLFLGSLRRLIDTTFFQHQHLKWTEKATSEQATLI